MNRAHIVDTLHKALGEPDQLSFVTKEEGKPDVVTTVNAKEALEGAVGRLIPELSLELHRINGKYISENQKPNNTNPITTPLSYLIEGLENDA